MNEVMLALGDYRFSVDSAAYQQLVRTTTYRWQQQDRIGRAPAMQFLGTGTDSIELNGSIYPHYKGGLGQLQTMRDQAGSGTPQLLVDGLGKVHGDWCINEIEEQQTQFDRRGVPLKQEFRLRITAYGEDA
mgnify:CR=1 FL=1